jgi:hypothetical protein
MIAGPISALVAVGIMFVAMLPDPSRNDRTREVLALIYPVARLWGNQHGGGWLGYTIAMAAPFVAYVWLWIVGRFLKINILFLILGIAALHWLSWVLL